MPVPTLLVVDGAAIKAPSSLTWSVNDVSSPDAGRTLDGVMHKERLPLPGGQKRKLKLTWNMVRFGTEPQGSTVKSTSAGILQAFKPEYISVTFPDPQEGTTVTKTFYTGDKELEFKTWWTGAQLLTNLSFSIIEQ